MLAAWLAVTHRPDRCVAWLSLDQGDGRPAVFWAYLITALQSAVPGLGADVLPLLQSSQPPIETVLTAVLNELSVVPHEIDLVLDDYHHVDGPAIGSGMTFLLEHLPAQVHLVISSRSDPALPLPRLRAQGELVEVRAADLRFTPDEVAAYLVNVAGLDLAAPDIAALAGRTEGWIAALQLAAVSMQGRDDLGAFVAGFAGDDRYIVDYLVQEVLRGQPGDIRTFLLRTCLLDRLSGPLCDALTGERGGKATLEALERANLFVISLDDNRQWYRYHHLFADMLRTRLRDERADEITDLHRRASLWFDRDGQPEPAIRHAVAAGDLERAADLVELASPVLRRNRQEATIRRWLDLIPDEIVRRRPVLAVDLAAAMMASNEFDGVEERLQDAERWCGRRADEGPQAQSGGGPMVDRRDVARLPGVIEMSRAGLALVRGDLAATVRHAQAANDRAPADDHVTRAGAAALSGLACWSAGDLGDADRAYSAAIEGLHRAGHISDVLGCSIALADIRSTQGHLGDAQATYERALRLASAESAAGLRGTADMYVGMSRIACERGDLPAAEQYLRRSQELGEHLGLPQNPYRSRVARAEVRQSAGDLAGALSLLDEAQGVYVGDYSPDVRPVPAMRARVLAALGHVPPALHWARERGLSPDDEPTYLGEFEHIVLARVLLAGYPTRPSTTSRQRVARLLARLEAAAEAGGRRGSLIEILVLQALIHRAGGDAANALASLERALTLAEPAGYVRVFLNEGAPIVSLLEVIGRRRHGWDYVDELVAFNDPLAARAPASSPGVSSGRRGQVIVDPLSRRELDVLRLLASDLTGPDIARRLLVSINTVRTHTKSIYAKLGVNGRRGAIRRGQELDLLPRGH